ncbi:MAG: HDIG domain-containing protein [candidate division Zixibacteria bacterium]|nr:HDIG domain-containing protein [candidate division Zixibacteria bacterium]
MFRLLIRIKRFAKKKLKLSGTVRHTSSRDKLLYKSVLILVIGLMITLLYPQQQIFQAVSIPRLDEIAREDIVAPFAFEVKRPQDQVDREIRDTLDNLPVILNYNFGLYENVYSSIGTFFSHVRDLKESNLPLARKVDSLNSIKEDVDIAVLRELLKSNHLDTTENRLLKTIESIYQLGVLPDSIDLSEYNFNFAQVRKKQQQLRTPVENILTVGQTRDIFMERAESDTIFPHSPQGFASLGYSFIKPNLSINMAATNLNKKNKLDAIPHIEREFKAGEVIIKRNTKADSWHIRSLEAMTAEQLESGRKGSFWQKLLPYFGRGSFILFALVMLAVFLANYNNRRMFSNPKFTAMMLIIVLEVVAVYVIDHELNLSVYLIPFAIGAILLTIMFDLATGIFTTLIMAIIVGILQNFNFATMLLAFFSGAVASLSVIRVHKRSDFYRSILYLTVFYLVAVYLMEALKFSTSDEIIPYLGYGMVNAVLSPIIAMGFLPVFETMFGITTDLTLLELSDMNHPLLRRLALEAPGTYHHSIVVGNLCEKAAEAIDANPLLARVGSYYHDIGKMEIPEYFVENSQGNKSKHDSLSPSMSALIISSHVKKGLDLADQADLPDVIMDFIAEHHGTTLMSYFYHKARELKSENGGEEVPEEEYRYPGPRPHSKETAILMIADSVEAASRTLEDPKPSRIRNLVKKLINEKFQSGQLSDSELTMRDLSIMEDAFTQRVLSAFHTRVDYPQKEEAK